MHHPRTSLPLTAKGLIETGSVFTHKIKEHLVCEEEHDLENQLRKGFDLGRYGGGSVQEQVSHQARTQGEGVRESSDEHPLFPWNEEIFVFTLITNEAGCLQ